MSVLYLIAVPLLAAFISILFKKAAPYFLLIISFAAVVSLYFLQTEIVYIGGYLSPYGISLVVTDFTITTLYVVNMLFFLVVVTNLKKYQHLSSIMLVALAGLNGLMVTNDLFNLFVFLEISGIAAYLITTSNNKPQATFHYLVLGTVGSSFYLLGLVILYNMFGSLNLSDLASVLTTQDVSLVQVGIPFLFMFIGLGVEAKLLPFNSWVKGILSSANTLSGTLIASVYAAAIGFVFGRVFTELYSEPLSIIVTVILLASIFLGEAMAYASTKAKEILLFSSIAQSALAVLVFFSGLTGWAVILLSVNAFSKFVLFLIIASASEKVGSDEVDDLEGLFVENKVVGVSFTVAVLSVLGLPLFVGFVVKMNILTSFFSGNQFLFPAIILLSSVIEGVYFIKLLMKLWYGEKKEVSFTFITKYVVVIIAIFLIVYGIFNAEIIDLAENILMIGGIL